MKDEHRAIWQRLRDDVGRLRAQIRALGVTDDADIDDVLQETLIRVVLTLDRYDGRVSIGAYAFGIAVNVVRNWRRKAARRAAALQAYANERHGSPPFEDPTRRQGEQEVVQRALGALLFNDRVLLVALDVEDMKVSELSVALGIPESTLRSRHQQARKRFALELARVEEGEK